MKFDFKKAFASASLVKMNSDERARFYSVVMAMVNDGLPLDSALREMHKRMVLRKNPKAKMLKRWIVGMESGRAFSDVIADSVPVGELVLIASGERSNNLASGLEQAIRVLASQKKMSKVIGTLIFPLVLIIALAGIVIGFSMFMAPELTKILKPEKWGPSGKILYDFAMFVSAAWYIVVPAIAAVILGSIISLPRWTGAMREKMTKFPPWSIYRNFQSATFMVSISALMKAGVPLAEGIRHVETHASPWMADHLSAMQRRMRSGMAYSEALDTGLLNEDVSDEMSIYATTSDPDKAILAIGNRIIDGAIEKLEKDAAMIRNVVMILIAIMVAWIYTTVFSVSGKAAAEAKKQNRSSISIEQTVQVAAVKLDTVLKPKSPIA